MYLPVNRVWSKRIALVLIVSGILLFPDVIAPTPFMDLLLNVPLAWILADIMSVSFTEAFVFTYLIAFFLVIAGLMIYPYNTKRLVHGKITRSLAFIRSHPLLMIFAIIGLLLVHMMGQYLYDSLWQYAKEVISQVV